jgi:hypothetical protein
VSLGAGREKMDDGTMAGATAETAAAFKKLLRVMPWDVRLRFMIASPPRNYHGE